jgi:hypothetical protein
MEAMTEHSRLALYKAYAAAVAAMDDPKKNQTNPAFKRAGRAIGYADLGEVLSCIEGPLRGNGLLLLQAVTGTDLNTAVIHVDTNEAFHSSYPIKPAKDDPQGFAAAVTYARRQSLKTLFGLVDADDDGNAASQPAKPQSRPNAEAATKAMAPKGGGSFQTLDAVKTAINISTTVEQLQGIYQEISKSALSDEDKKAGHDLCKAEADKIKAKKTKKESA